MKSTSKKQPHSLKVKRSSAGLGLYTETFIPKGAFVIEYTGEIIPNEEADRRGGRYLFNIDEKWTIDGTKRHNTGRYLNHACKPNCEATQSGKRILINAKRNIQPGEELCYDYGKEYYDEFIKPAGCRCAHCATKQSK